MQRTIAEARQALDRLQLSPAEREEIRSAIESIVSQAVTGQDEMNVREHEEIRMRITNLKKAMGQVSRDMTALTEEAKASDISAADFYVEFKLLHDKRHQLIETAERLGSHIEDFEAREDDVEGYLDELYSKYPTLRPDFPV